jgi:hypothetical protein
MLHLWDGAVKLDERKGPMQSAVMSCKMCNRHSVCGAGDAVLLLPADPGGFEE